MADETNYAALDRLRIAVAGATIRCGRSKRAEFHVIWNGAFHVRFRGQHDHNVVMLMHLHRNRVDVRIRNRMGELALLMNRLYDAPHKMPTRLFDVNYMRWIYKAILASGVNVMMRTITSRLHEIALVAGLPIPEDPAAPINLGPWFEYMIDCGRAEIIEAHNVALDVRYYRALTGEHDRPFVIIHSVLPAQLFEKNRERYCCDLRFI